MTDSTQVEAAFDTPGSLLSQARDAKGLSTDDVAQKLRLKAAIIEALERDEVLSTISLTFTKGYVRSYAKLLGLDEAHIVELFTELHISDELTSKKMQSFSRRVARDHNDSRWMIVTYSIVALVILLSILWWVQHQSQPFFTSTSSTLEQSSEPRADSELRSESGLRADPEPRNMTNANSGNIPSVVATNTSDASNTTSSQVTDAVEQSDNLLEPNITGAEPILQNDEQLDAAAKPILGGDEQTNLAPASASSMTMTVATPRITESDSNGNENANAESVIPDFIPDTEPENISQVLTVLENNNPDVESELRLFNDDEFVEAPSDLVELIFSFSGDCWIKITDATGNDIAYGVKKAGRVMPVSGQAPFSVILGAPGSVNIQYDGQPIDISYLPSDRTGRFVLPLQD